MRNEIYKMELAGSMPYAKLVTYIQDESVEMDIPARPLVLVCPGGAYAFTSDREAEPLALQFLAMGYHAAVLRYSVAPATFPTSVCELAWSIRLIREHAEEWHVNPSRIIVLGCSAGGHLAASMGVFWNRDFLAKALGAEDADHRQWKPDGMILCYPVITSGEFAHRGSFDNVIGDREAEISAMVGAPALEALSLESQVSADTPPAFLWHTYTDDAVPVENSLMFVNAMRRAGVAAELHIYPVGGHGLSLANRLTQGQGGSAVQKECSSWISLAHTWIEGQE
ncbi:MAG: alpha/beta hydrolase [Lachnospiraceae bacterium]|nr:alpha/beta hydrolase [Lachnospiraceae bacterium]